MGKKITILLFIISFFAVPTGFAQEIIYLPSNEDLLEAYDYSQPESVFMIVSTNSLMETFRPNIGPLKTKIEGEKILGFISTEHDARSSRVHYITCKPLKEDIEIRLLSYTLDDVILSTSPGWLSMSTSWWKNALPDEIKSSLGKTGYEKHFVLKKSIYIPSWHTDDTWYDITYPGIFRTSVAKTPLEELLSLFDDEAAQYLFKKARAECGPKA